MVGGIAVFTIGFTGKTAERFFGLLKANGVTRLYDTRANNTSQLAAFAKAPDIEFFCRSLLDIQYDHRLDMAPTKDLLASYRAKQITWTQYTGHYIGLLEKRQVAASLDVSQISNSCLLCSEHEPDYCHRRILADYLRTHFPAVSIHHLV